VRVEPKIIGIAAAAHNPYSHSLSYEIYTVWMTNWPFYLKCVTPGVSVVTSFKYEGPQPREL